MTRQALLTDIAPDACIGPDARIGIVGAGASGLTVAHYLAEAGYEDVMERRTEAIMSNTGSVTIDTLKGFLDAFNRHDVEEIMAYFADDCVVYMPRGVGPRGDCYTGKEEVRTAVKIRFAGLPDVHYGGDSHWVCGDFGVSKWLLTGTTPAGNATAVRGVDLLEFRDGLIIRKDSYWKIVDD